MTDFEIIQSSRNEWTLIGPGVSHVIARIQPEQGEDAERYVAPAERRDADEYTMEPPR